MGPLSERVRRYLTFVIGLIECVGFVGVIYGWASLVFVLKEKGYFSDLCVPLHNNSDSGARNGTKSAVLLFPAFSLLAVGGKIFFITNIQVGNLFENKRSTIITLYNGAFTSSAAVFLLVKVLYEAGLSLMSMFLFITCLSSILLLHTFFLLPRTRIPHPVPEGYSYGVSCAKFRLMSFCCEEQRVKETPPHHRGDRTQGEEGERREWTAGDRGEKQEETEQDRAERWEETKVTDCVNPQPSGSQDSEGNEEEIPSFRSCISSKLFLFTLLWLSIIQLRDSLFIGTLNPTLTLLAKGDSGQVSRLTNAFACIQFCGIFCAPWNGLIMDRHKCRKKPTDAASGSPDVITQHPRSRRLSRLQHLADMKSTVLSISITTSVSVLFSICATIPVLEVQYLTFVLQVISHSFLYGGYATFIAIAFRPCHFGKVFGLGQALSAVVSLFQYPCFVLVQGPLRGNPLYLNIGFILLVALSYAHPINVYLYCQRETQQRSMVQPSPVEVPWLGEQDDQAANTTDA
ncbi:solute carrier family 43 member 3-like isoform X2 [Carcharodon carcharias]|uniref:solute carrier family 43 member 3-like isoform X2 n=1 Tax=Carcharodon carcharias TaxID=13397 RepID=UPI001B7E3312|nr:solute carrier family 43 member 3-like isoform X2 [Carcharodon carcharias]